MIYYEDVLLRTLRFNVEADHPFTYALEAVERIFGSNKAPVSMFEGRPAPERPLSWHIHKIAWEFIVLRLLSLSPLTLKLKKGSSYLTPLCIMVPANAIAAGALLLACTRAGVVLQVEYNTWYLRISDDGLPIDGAPDGNQAIVQLNKEWASLFRTKLSYAECKHN